MKFTDEQIEKAAKVAHESRTQNLHMPSNWDRQHEWDRIVERRAIRAALEAVMPEGEPSAHLIWRPGTGWRVEMVGRGAAEFLAGEDGDIVPLYEHPAPEPGELERLREAARKARAVLAQAASAGWNAGGPTPEDTEAAFWSLDAALAEGGGDE